MSAPVWLSGGVLVDGTGAPRRPADLLRGDRVAVSEPGGGVPEGAEVVASGLVVAPGFIDVMSHSVATLLTDGRSVGKTTQGVTTDVREGWTPAPAAPGEPRGFTVPGLPGGDERWIRRSRGWTRFGDWLAAQAAVGAAVNFGSFLGGTTVRLAGRGHAAGAGSPQELAAVRRTVREALADGVFGLATALIYPPGSYADTDELVALCEEVACGGGVYITRMRSEGDGLLSGLAEALEISRRSGARGHLYHKAAGRSAWPKMAEAIARTSGRRRSSLTVPRSRSAAWPDPRTSFRRGCRGPTTEPTPGARSPTSPPRGVRTGLTPRSTSSPSPAGSGRCTA